MTFTSESTTDEVLADLDLTGRRFVITGAASGLGEESTRALAAHRASVLMLARDRAKNDAAAASRSAPMSRRRPVTRRRRFADLASIRSFAARFLDGGGSIDVLINNAGVMACPFGRTADGFEMQFGTNHLGHFELTRLLAAAVIAGDRPRIVNLSSAGARHLRRRSRRSQLRAHRLRRVDFLRPVEVGERAHAVALARRLADDGVLAFSVRPGGIMTNLGRHLNDDLMQQMLDRAKERSAKSGESGGMQFKSIPQGAATQVWAATSPDVADHSGAYLADCGLGVLGANVGRNGFEPYIADESRADALWVLSEQLVDGQDR